MKNHGWLPVSEAGSFLALSAAGKIYCSLPPVLLYPSGSYPGNTLHAAVYCCFVACVDQRGEKIKDLLEELDRHYNVLTNENVTLLTVRHYTPEVVADLTKNRYILLEQKTRHTVQMVLK